MAQSVWRGLLGDSRLGHRQLARLLDGRRRERHVRRLAREKIVAWPLEFPILAKTYSKMGRKRAKRKCHVAKYFHRAEKVDGTIRSDPISR